MNRRVDLSLLALLVASLFATIASVHASAIERTLIGHYYQSILRRVPDAGGLAYWESEIARLRGQAQEPREAFVAMSSQFLDSPEYRGFNRTDEAYLADLYQTFFQRAADPGGLQFWKSQLAQGMPRGVVLAGFQFSPEFNQFVATNLGLIGARSEGTVLIDLYRGYLNRLPDQDGLGYWLGQFRTAQCMSLDALADRASQIASLFQSSAEYVGRGRDNAQFVGDLYSAFLRRGGELSGVQYWISQLNQGVSRASVRNRFVASAEFQGRIADTMSEGCFQPNPPPTVVDRIAPGTQVASGTRIILYGSGFRWDTRVAVNGVATGPIHLVSANEMAFAVPFTDVGGRSDFMPAGTASITVDGFLVGSLQVVVPPVLSTPPGQLFSQQLEALALSMPSAEDRLLTFVPELRLAYPSGSQTELVIGVLSVFPAVEAIAAQLPSLLQGLPPETLALMDRAFALALDRSADLNAGLRRRETMAKAAGDDWLLLRAGFVRLEDVAAAIEAIMDALGPAAKLNPEIELLRRAYPLVRNVSLLALDTFTINRLALKPKAVADATASASAIEFKSITGRGTLSAGLSTQVRLDFGRYARNVLGVLQVKDGIKQLIDKHLVTQPGKATLAKSALDGLAKVLAKASESLVYEGPVVPMEIALDRLELFRCDKGSTLPLSGQTEAIHVKQFTALQQDGPEPERCLVRLPINYLTISERRAIGDQPNGRTMEALGLTSIRRRTVLQVTANPAAARIGDIIRFTAEVSAAPEEVVPGNIRPSKGLEFFEGAKPLCPAGPLDNGISNCSTSFSTAGTHIITARYRGDPDFEPTSDFLNIVINPEPKLDFATIPEELFARLQYEFVPTIDGPFNAPGPYDCEWSGFGGWGYTLARPDCSFPPWGNASVIGNFEVTLTLKQKGTGALVGSITKPVSVYPGPGFDQESINYKCVDRIWIDSSGNGNHHLHIDISATAYLQKGMFLVGAYNADVTSCGIWRSAVEGGKTYCYRDADRPVSSVVSVHDEQVFYSASAIVTAISAGGLWEYIYETSAPGRSCSVVGP